MGRFGQESDEAAEFYEVRHYFRAALTEEQRKSGYTEKIAEKVGLPNEKTRHYCKVDPLNLSIKPISRRVKNDGTFRKGLTEEQKTEVQIKQIGVEISSMQDLINGSATVFINPDGGVHLSDSVLGKKIGVVTAENALEQIVTDHVRSLEGDKMNAHLTSLRAELERLIR
ncbi:Uncharacterised protein [uncultured archaeon]|nr:Uncharacterised protein [uncultured archaeon]